MSLIRRLLNECACRCGLLQVATDKTKIEVKGAMMMLKPVRSQLAIAI
jgi:hypothetical protein